MTEERKETEERELRDEENLAPHDDGQTPERARKLMEDEETERLKAEEQRKKRKWLLISVSVAAAGIVITLILALLSTQKTIVRNGIIGGIFLTVTAWTAIFLYFTIAFPDRFTGRKIRNLLIHKQTKMTGPVSKRIRITLLDWPKYVLALMGAVLVAGVIFLNVDSVPVRKKITFFVNTFQESARGLEDALYEARPEGITRVRAHMFAYSLLSTKEIHEADVFIIHESDFESFRENCTDLTAFREAHPEFTYLTAEGVPYAIKIYDAGSRTGAATSLLSYEIPEPDPSVPVEVNPDAVYTDNEDYYLFISNESMHAASLRKEGAKGDDAAIEMILYFMTLK